jgi:hypothetical protein
MWATSISMPWRWPIGRWRPVAAVRRNKRGTAFAKRSPTNGTPLSWAPDLSAEPTRSVLHRSAAALAVECGEAREAERLIAVALAGNPPEEIAEELRDLWQELRPNLRKQPAVAAG